MADPRPTLMNPRVAAPTNTAPKPEPKPEGAAPAADAPAGGGTPAPEAPAAGGGDGTTSLLRYGMPIAAFLGVASLVGMGPGSGVIGLAIKALGVASIGGFAMGALNPQTGLGRQMDAAFPEIMPKVRDFLGVKEISQEEMDAVRARGHGNRAPQSPDAAAGRGTAPDAPATGVERVDLEGVDMSRIRAAANLLGGGPSTGGAKPPTPGGREP